MAFHYYSALRSKEFAVSTELKNNMLNYKACQPEMLLFRREQSAIIAEEMRKAKRALLANIPPANDSADGKKANLIMVTSLTGGDGKTFFSWMLSRSLATEMDRQILLVDAAPKIGETAREFSSPFVNHPPCGLMEYLYNTDNRPLSDFVYQTETPNLRYIAAGSQSAYLATELFTSQRMSKLLNEFRERYDDRLVVIDGFPLLGFNESQALLPLVDHIIVVVDEGAALKSELVDAIKLLPTDIPVYFVINKCVNTNSRWKWLKNTL